MGAVCERRTWCGKRGHRVLEMGAVCERRTVAVNVTVWFTGHFSVVLEVAVNVAVWWM